MFGSWFCILETKFKLKKNFTGTFPSSTSSKNDSSTAKVNFSSLFGMWY